MFKNHNPYNSNKEDEIFTGFCKEENHYDKLNYFCKNHNKLCCASCITKIKSKGNGQHTDCNVCNIEEIKLEKQNSLKKLFKNVESLSNMYQQLYNELKINFEKLNNTNDLKIKIQNIFKVIKAEINERER